MESGRLPPLPSRLPPLPAATTGFMPDNTDTGHPSNTGRPVTAVLALPVPHTETQGPAPSEPHTPALLTLPLDEGASPAPPKPKDIRLKWPQSRRTLNPFTREAT